MTVIRTAVWGFLIALSAILSVLTVAVFAYGDLRTAWQFLSTAACAAIAAGMPDVLGRRV